MKKRGFTLVEVLASCCMMSFILLLGMGIVKVVNTIIFEGQIESNSRINLSDNIYYVTRELQSAEAILVSADLKQLKIMQDGDSDYTTNYTITNNCPVGVFSFNGKKMFSLNYNDSYFKINGNTVSIEIATIKDSVNPNHSTNVLQFCITPRNGNVKIEVGE